MSQEIPKQVCPFSGQLASRVCLTPGCDKVPFICKGCENDECMEAHQHGGRMNNRNWEVVAKEISKIIELPKNEEMEDIKRANQAFEALKASINQLHKNLNEKVNNLRSRDRNDQVRRILLKNLYEKNYKEVTGEAIRRLITNEPLEAEQRQRQECNREIREACRSSTELMSRISDILTSYERHSETIRRSSQLRRDAEKYLRDGQDDFAEKCLSEAVELCPSDYESLEDRAGLLFKKKRLDDALKDLDRVLELSVNSHYSHYLKGKILMTKRDFAGALTEFNEAIKITDSKPEYYEKRGNCQFELGRYQKALSDYSFVLKMRRSPWDYLNEAAVYNLLDLKVLYESGIEHGFRMLDENPEAGNQEPFEAYAFDRMELRLEDRKSNAMGIFDRCDEIFKR